MRLPLGPRPTEPPKAAGAIALAAVVAAVAVAFGPWAAWPRAAAAVALLTFGGLAYDVLVRRARRPRSWLVVDDRGLSRADGAGESHLVEWREPFGATVLARADRRAVVIALTSPRAVRFVPVRVGEDAVGAPAPPLADRAATVPDSDLRIDDAAALDGADAERLLDAISGREPGAIDRVFLSDAGGEPLVFDRSEVRAGARRIDLSAPLEWRGFLFQEQGAQILTYTQATWVRQGDTELVFVAPTPTDVGAMRSGPDARLLDARSDGPPPRELRRAIDRVFMMPLRRALDRAPRISRVPSSPSHRRPEGRA